MRLQDETWNNIGRVFDVRKWPGIGKEGWFANPFKERVATMREAAEFVANRMPVAVKHPDQSWTRGEVAWVVDRLIRDQLGICEYALDDDCGRDLGVE